MGRERWETEEKGGMRRRQRGGRKGQEEDKIHAYSLWNPEN